MCGTEYLTVSAYFSEFGDKMVKLILICLTEECVSHSPGDVLHFRSNCRVLIGKVCMTAACIGYTNAVACITEIKVNAFDLGVIRCFKVDSRHASDRACHLIHKSACFAKVEIFRILSDTCYFFCASFFAAEYAVYDSSDQHFKSCRG